ncbi:hypothetical protein [Riemerella columbipharyngis]|uniref:Outer membrane protein beta-barrel domain-containing protein n=1 Tax=Riemerella columbipharyngis TaxID=1071918 RepID=A0A1G6ZUG9_9FLAO|nr:hypothetical protein [Riemerella columbipharyngis]SDE05485.1 hypothetical protein SAMN05421544_102190 [Riemerella columbipharyngis]
MENKAILVLFTILFLSCNAQQQKKSNVLLILGGNWSQIEASSPSATSLVLTSGNKIGYFIEVGKEYSIFSKRLSLEVSAKFSETGGHIDNNAYFLKTNLSNDIEKYKNAKLKLFIYEFSSGIKLIHSYQAVKVYMGIQSSLLFLGRYTEKNIKEIPPQKDSIPNKKDIDKLIIKIHHPSFKTEIGMRFSLDTKYFIDFSCHFPLQPLFVIYNNNGLIINIKESYMQLGIGIKI